MKMFTLFRNASIHVLHHPSLIFLVFILRALDRSGRYADTSPHDSQSVKKKDYSPSDPRETLLVLEFLKEFRSCNM